ncbi:hypothetical protein HK097_009228 [Rhizophlyctis rosea]|uniref:Arrestin C-terminal-like domain-containing protein n=1 Tax=Rhizophlyctis rosea TaxID=64517 RepID=A0AAD5X3D6_9FUNG|nr:hypothetical protein HK097_009228 [Rhizophlyctis rosea]
MGLRDLEITPLEGELNFLHGYLGVTETVTVRGLLKLTATSSLKIRTLRISLEGIINTYIKTRDSKVHEATNVLISETTNLLSLLISDNSSYRPATPSKKTITLPKGDHAIPFEILIPAIKCRTIPASHVSEQTEDAKSFILYELKADVVTVRGIFSSDKTHVVTEEIDVPRVNVPAVVRAATTTANVILEGTEDSVDYKIEVEPSVFGVDQPVHVHVHGIIPNSPKLKISGLSVFLRQIETIRANGQQRQITTSVAVPDSTLKLRTDKAVNGAERWFGDLSISVPATHMKLKKDKQKKLKSGKIVDVFPSFDADLIAVHHVISVVIKFKGGKVADVKLEAPAVFIDADHEIRDWVLKHYQHVEIKPMALRMPMMMPPPPQPDTEQKEE